MSDADKIFKEMCIDILENGTDTKGEIVRPIWKDTNEKAYTIKKFGVVNRYDLRKEFPALTLRKTGIKTAFDELLWIWQAKDNNTFHLHSHIWDQWADDTGSIGRAYGYQIGQSYYHHRLTKEDIKNLCDELCNNITSDYASLKISSRRGVDYLELDQTDAILWDLKHNPYSRRIMANMYNFEDLHKMNLYPCAYSVTFNCTRDEVENKLILNCILNQRSQDVLVANNWNVCQYALLVMMFAQCCNMIPGELVHVISDCHIYDRHIPIIKELISKEEYPAPKVYFDPDITNFYRFTVENLHIENYITGDQITNIPVAV